MLRARRAVPDVLGSGGFSGRTAPVATQTSLPRASGACCRPHAAGDGRLLRAAQGAPAAGPAGGAERAVRLRRRRARARGAPHGGHATPTCRLPDGAADRRAARRSPTRATASRTRRGGRSRRTSTGRRALPSARRGPSATSCASRCTSSPTPSSSRSAARQFPTPGGALAWAPTPTAARGGGALAARAARGARALWRAALRGAQLEDGGGAGTDSCHWEMRWRDEATGAASPGGACSRR